MLPTAANDFLCKPWKGDVLAAGLQTQTRVSRGSERDIDHSALRKLFQTFLPKFHTET